MNKPYLPYSRDCDEKHTYDEGYMVLCSQNPDDLIKYFDNIGYVIDFVLHIEEFGVSEELPWLTPAIICKKYPKAKLLVDDALPQSVQQKIHKIFDATDINIIPISSLTETCPDTPCECTTLNLSIDALGDIYPCPKPKVKKRQIISNISNENCLTELKNFVPEPCVCKKGFLIPARDPFTVKRVAIEFGGLCSSACTYCYQRHTFKKDGVNKGDNYNYSALEKFLDGLTISEICVAGGEVLAQNNTIEFLKHYKAKHPEIKFVLKTNGYSTQFDLLGTNLFERVAISMNGFNQNTVSTIMSENIRIETVKEFCRQCVRKCEYTQIKFLLSPISINDFPEFIDWAIGLKPQEISVTKAMVFGSGKDGSFSGSSFKGINHAYWDDMILRISQRSIKSIQRYSPELLKTISFRFGLGTGKLLKIEELLK